jgi:hypothetical protein
MDGWAYGEEVVSHPTVACCLRHRERLANVNDIVVPGGVSVRCDKMLVCLSLR